MSPRNAEQSTTALAKHHQVSHQNKRTKTRISVYLWHGVYTDTVPCPGCNWELLLLRCWWCQCHCSYSGCSHQDLRLWDRTNQANSRHTDDLLLQPYIDTDLQPRGEKNTEEETGRCANRETELKTFKSSELLMKKLFSLFVCTWAHSMLPLIVPALWQSQGWHTSCEVGSVSSGLKNPLIHSSQFLPYSERDVNRVRRTEIKKKQKAET